MIWLAEQMSAAESISLAVMVVALFVFLGFVLWLFKDRL